MRAQERASLRLAVSAPLTGANAAYGTGLVEGVRLGLAPLLADGVAGRRLELAVLDDGGVPARAAANAVALLQREVVAFTALHGSRSIEAVLPHLVKANVPLVGAATSAEKLRDPSHPLVYHLRAGAADELWAIVTHLDTLGVERVAVVVQDGSLGAAGLEGLTIELARLGLRPDGVVSLPANAGQADAANAITKLCKTSTPQAVLLSLETTLALETVRAARQSACGRVTFATLSETGGALLAAPPEEARGILVAQPLPHPAKFSHPLVARFRSAVTNDQFANSYAALEGYVYGRVLAEVLVACGARAGSACIRETLDRRPPQLPGWKLALKPDNHRGTRFVEITMLDGNGKVKY